MRKRAAKASKPILLSGGNPQIAKADGPSFLTDPEEPIPAGQLYPSNTVFPILLAGLQQQSGGLSPIPANQSGTVTVDADAGGVVFHVVIPALNVDVTATCLGGCQCLAPSWESTSIWAGGARKAMQPIP